VWWVLTVDVVVLLAGLALLGLTAWRLVLRPGARLARAVVELAEATTRAGEQFAAAASPSATAAVNPSAPGARHEAGGGARRTVAR